MDLNDSNPSEETDLTDKNELSEKEVNTHDTSDIGTLQVTHDTSPTKDSLTPPPTVNEQSTEPVTSTDQNNKQKKSALVTYSIVIIAILILLLMGGLLVARSFFQTELKKNTAAKTVPVNESATTLQSVVKSGMLTIGSDTTYPPMESVDSKGNMVGYDIDLGNRIGQELGVKTQFKTILFDDIFNQLIGKKYDMIISSITITDERKQKYGFSDPYLNAGEVIITRKDNILIKSPNDLKGKRVGVEKNTTEEKEAPKYTTLVVSYPDNVPAISDLKIGKLDGVLTDLPNAKGIIDKNPELKIASDPFTADVYGVVFRKEDTTFINKVNQILAKLQQNGYLTDLKHKWLE